MTLGAESTGTPPAPVAPSAADATVDRLSAELLRHARLTHVLKTILSSWAPSNLDWGAYGLLLHLVKDGPRRQGELAESVLLEPSTVSRRVGQLVQLGYVERRADPGDGRAVQLVATAAGQAVFDQLRARREEVFRQLLGRWDDDDVEDLAVLLTRLNDDLETYRPLLVRVTAAEPVPPFPARPAPHLAPDPPDASGAAPA
jgi:DNA-binding MarR family transcriptional regulator